MKKLLVLAVLALASVAAQAHSGGTNASGCHTDHKTGVFHCH